MRRWEADFGPLFLMNVLRPRRVTHEDQVWGKIPELDHGFQVRMAMRIQALAVVVDFAKNEQLTYR
jgi:hypothetical protein